MPCVVKKSLRDRKRVKIKNNDREEKSITVCSLEEGQGSILRGNWMVEGASHLDKVRTGDGLIGLFQRARKYGGDTYC